MSDKRKIGPIRQLSLQSENHRIRPILKKQLSVEQLDRIEEHKLQQPPRVESAKNKLHDRPRPIKVAWAENRTTKEEIPHKGKFSDTVEVKKCKEHKRPTTAKLRTQSSIEKESVLYTRQELAERLRKAWKEREDNKQNLDIFLNQHHQNTNQSDRHFDDLENENYYPDYEDKCVLEKINATSSEEEIIAQFKPTTFINNTNNNTKYMNNKVAKNPENEFNYIPSTTSSRPQDVRTITNLSVTIPSVNSLAVKHHQPIQENQDSSPPISLLENPENKETPKKLVKQSSMMMSPKENLPPSRPHTASAASKRESFQKRTNTAFTGSITGNITGNTTSNTTEKSLIRPPLIRAVSVPSARPNENNKLKFIATKRRLKSARKRNKEGANTSENPDENEEKTTKKGSRCKSAPNGDVVTMVSLVSPAGSDTEEVAEPKKEQKGRNTSSPVKNQQTNLESVNKSIALRKSVKSVSFQQSSIHAVRSFSASFPARRGILTASASITAAYPEREKRAPMETTPGGEFRGPKRRLVKSFSVTGDDNINQRINPQDRSMKYVQSSAKNITKYGVNKIFNSSNENPSNVVENEFISFEETSLKFDKDSTTKSKILSSSKSLQSSTEDDSHEEKVQNTDATNDDEKEENADDSEEEEEVFDPTMPKFETNKEKECWIMYKKMSEKGLPVSFDTILRGMLTPTEYRNVRKEIQSTSS